MRQLLDRARTRAGIRRPVLVLALLLAAVALLAPAAAADPGGCHQPPEPARHGEGMVGQLDNAALGQGEVGSPYYEQGYDALTWHTYGTTGVCAVSYPWASADTWLGNQELYAAETITAAVNGLHYLTLDNVILPNLDGIMGELPVVLYDSVFTPYFAVVALLAAVLILWWSHTGEMANIGKKVFWMMAGLAFASLTYLVPLAYTPVADDVLVHGTEQLQSGILKQAGWADTRDGLPDMLYTETLYRPWLMGEFGNDFSPEAQRHGRDLLRAQGCTKLETIERNCNTEQKQDQYTNIANQLENTPAYRYFSGDQGRTSAGFSALIKSACYSLFQLACKAGLLLMQIIVRGVILAGPVLGLVAILSNNILPKIFRALGGAVGLGIVLTLVGTVHAYMLAWVANPAHGFSEGTQLIIMVLITGLMWISVRPWRTLRQMAASTLGMQLPDPAQERMARSMRRRRRNVMRVFRGLKRGVGGVSFDRDFWTERGEDLRTPTASDAGDDASSDGGGLAHRQRPFSGGGYTRPEGRIYAYAARADQDTAAAEPALATAGRAGELRAGPPALDGPRGEDDPPPRGPRGPRGGPRGPQDQPHSPPDGTPHDRSDHRPPELPEGGPRHETHHPPETGKPPTESSGSDLVVPSEEERRQPPRPRRQRPEQDEHHDESTDPPHRPEREE